MNQNILKYLKNHSYDTLDVNRLFVTAFLKLNGILEVQNNFISSFIISQKNTEEFLKFNDFVNLFDEQPFGIEELIEFFEFVISPVDKEVNGAVFTPEYIRNYIVSNVIEKKMTEQNQGPANLLYGDIACGCGGFFKTITEYIRRATNKRYLDIYRENIFGLDIQEYSIIRTKILLSLLAISNNEDSINFEFNLYCGNALSFDWSDVENVYDNGGFDIVVGNPPYVGVTKMDDNTKSLLKFWSVSSTGKPDLYIPFFEIGMKNLNANGVLGYITVNTFYKSLNGRSVRNYFSNNSFDLSIVDFGGEQLFKNRSTYTCICIIGKMTNPFVNYVKSLSKNIGKIDRTDFVSIPYAELDDHNGWYLVDDNLKKIISKIETTGKPLGDKHIIRNGFATLKNNIFLFKPIKESLEFYFFMKDGVKFKVEKEICRDAIKPNTLKSAEELSSKMEKLLFPYIIEKKQNDLFGSQQSNLKIISPENFQLKFPNAYKYLRAQKKILSERDKGGGEYEHWYAFGRNQALTLSGYKLLFPYISDRPNFVFTEDKNLLFYNGYTILSDSIEDLLILQKILMSNIFWFYIKNTSKPYSGKFFSIAKNYIKKFGVCELSPSERNNLLKLEDQSAIDKFLMKIYNINVEL